MMNEFVGKKLGEILAFNRVGIDTYEKGRAALVEILGEEKVKDIEERDRMHGDSIVQIATEGGVIDITNTKAAATEEKLKKMRDLYVADQWDNATELMEWSGFFEGAAIVHYALMQGSSQALDNDALATLTEEGINYHYEMLEMAEGHLEKIGQDKASAA
ncbi:MAG TPA: hypothetical protein VL576_02185 [Candidatus Paceibacterota bacterium]|jgi:hypothetical protein|nr:hypothetical protein [Candidatus Paceibacterota bacterium]